VLRQDELVLVDRAAVDLSVGLLAAWVTYRRGQPVPSVAARCPLYSGHLIERGGKFGVIVIVGAGGFFGMSNSKGCLLSIQVEAVTASRF
jgi:hypothetical protein